MKKIYCDVCDAELTVTDAFVVTAELDVPARNDKLNMSVSVTAGHHSPEVCRYCIISAVAALDDRPGVAPAPPPSPLLAIRTVNDLRAAFPELSAAVFDEGQRAGFPELSAARANSAHEDGLQEGYRRGWQACQSAVAAQAAYAAYAADPPPPPRNAIKTPYDEDWGKLNTLDYYAKNDLRAVEQEVHAERREMDQKAATAHMRGVYTYHRYKIDSDGAALGLALRALEAAEANRREAKSMNTDPVSTDPNADYGAAGHVLARAAQHLDESIPNGQRVRTEKAFYAAGVGLELLGEWLRAKGHEV